jgi:hypothetical protein
VSSAASFIWRDELAVRWLAVAGCVIAILGAKLWLIAAYGSNVPFWDQWDEGSSLYLPYLAGKLSIADIFAAHNEHRIAIARLMHLAQFVAVGSWQPVLETIIAALVHSAAAGLTVAMLARSLKDADVLLLSVFGALLFAVPVGWSNTLVGFQVQFYLLILLAPATIWILAPSTAFSLRWLAGTLLAISAYFTVASGALTIAACASITLLQLVFGLRRGRIEWIGLLAHVAIFATMLWAIPILPHHADLKPKSILGLYEALCAAASWPVAKSSWPLSARTITGLLIYLPPIMLTLALLRGRAPVRDSRWLAAGLAAFCALQLLAVASGRGVSVLENRYLDLFVVSMLACAGSLLCLLNDSALEGRRVVRVFACVWFTAITIGIGYGSSNAIPGGLSHWQQVTKAQHVNLRRFLTTGDESALADKPSLHVPYPHIDRLKALTSDPQMRAILPPELFNRPEAPTKFETFALRRGPLLFAIGIALFMVAGLLAGRGLAHRER